MAEMTDKEKEEALYRASLPAFFTNEIEIDKIILTLSVGAIGFYSALLTGGNLELTESMSNSMTISIVLYGVTVGMIIGIFNQNKKQLISIISTNGKGEEDPHLTFLDKYKYMPFAGAVVFSIIFMFPLVSKNTNKNEIPIPDTSKEQLFEREYSKSSKKEFNVGLLISTETSRSKVKKVNNRSNNSLNKKNDINFYKTNGFIKFKEGK